VLRGLFALRLADAHAPHFRALLFVGPGELAFVFGGKLIVKRLGIVVVHQHERLALAQAMIRLKNQRMPLRRTSRLPLTRALVSAVLTVSAEAGAVAAPPQQVWVE
jgi:hypothetical protein